MFQKRVIPASYVVFCTKILIFAFFLFSFFCVSLQAESYQNLIHLNHHFFDPKVSIPQIPNSLFISSKSHIKYENKYFILQFHGPILKSDLNSLFELSISIFDYIPNNAFIIRASESNLNQIKQNKRVRWIGPFKTQYRISPDVMEQVSTISPKNIDHKPLMLRISVFPGENLDEILDKISLLGTIINKHTTHWKTSLQLEINHINIPKLSKIDGIKWISMLPKWQLMNNIASQIIKVNQVRQHFGLYGEGQIIAVCDTGLDQGKTEPEFLHDDFEDGNGNSRVKNIFNLTPVMFNDAPDDIFSGHGTHVAGTILGNGYSSGSQPQLDNFPKSAYVGVAPKASLVFQAAEDSSTGMLLGLMLDLNQIFAQAHFAQARIHSNSWGAASGSTYSTECADVDQFMWDYKDFLIVFAAGNSGIDMDHDGRIDQYSISSPAASKNCLTVGGSESVRSNEGYTCAWGHCWSKLYAKDPIASDFLSDNADGMAAFSSRGPTLDGRYKPDIVAPSTNILSTKSSRSNYDGWGHSSNEQYLFMGGTSMATPIVAGSAALMREYIVKTGITEPSSALIKAALLNAAESMSGQYTNLTNPEIPDITPNNVNGWGRVNLEKGVYPEEPNNIIYKYKDSLETNAFIDYFFEVIDSNVNLKINLVWTDFPGSPVAQGGLVNDIDIHLIGPNEQIHYPDAAKNQSIVKTYKYDMNFPIFQTDINQCGMRFTPEQEPCFLDAISISISNPEDVQDDIWIRVYEQNDSSFQLRYEKKYQYLPSGWTTLPIDNLKFTNNDFLVTIEKTNPNIQICSDFFSSSGRGMIKQSGSWENSNETFYIRAYVRQQNHATPYDRVNNCLGISLTNPQTGAYRVQVIGYNIPKGPQPFALVARGAIKESPPHESLSLHLPQKVKEGDGTLKEIGLISINKALDKSLTVYLTSSDSTEIIVPQQLVLDPGQTKIRFDIQIIDDPSEDGEQIVVIEAKANNYLTASSTVIVEDNDARPVLVVNPTRFIAHYTEGVAIFTVTNTGTAKMEWSAEVDENWLKIIEGHNGIDNGSIKVQFEKNPEKNRIGHLIIDVEDYPNLTQTIEIHQKAEKIEVIISPSDGYKYDYLGFATSIWNNIALIGAYKHDHYQKDSGAAYIYQFDGTAWQALQKIYASDGARKGYFGSAVSIFDSQIVVGAYNDDTLGKTAGAAYIFEFIDNKWVETAKVNASDGKRNDYFAQSVDIYNNIMVAGAYKSDTYGTNSGAAYVFEKKDDSWTETCRLYPYNLQKYDYFGISTAIYENNIIIGAHGDDYRGSASGTAYIFEKIDNAWEQKEKLIPEGLRSNDYFGFCVDISKKYAVVGAYKTDKIGPNTGAAYVYEKNDGRWINSATLYPWEAKGYDYFGSSVSVSDDYIVVGAYGDKKNGWQSGAGYVFQNINGIWKEICYLTASDGDSNDKFGYSVSISKNGQVLVGAYGNDSNGSKSGIAYIYSALSPKPSQMNKTVNFPSIQWGIKKQIINTKPQNAQNIFTRPKIFSNMFFNNNKMAKVKSESFISPSISYTQIPEIGNRIKNLTGKIIGQMISSLEITVYTFINEQWHLKASSVPVYNDGIFEIDITTIYGDHMATSIAIFVLSKSISIKWPDKVDQFPDLWEDVSLINDIIER